MPGGGDAGSLLPGVLPPELGASRNEPGQTRRCLQLFVPHTPHTHHAPHTTHHTVRSLGCRRARSCSTTGAQVDGVEFFLGRVHRHTAG